MHAITNTSIGTRRDTDLTVMATAGEGIIFRVQGRVANVSFVLHPDEASAVARALDAAVAVLDSGVQE